MVAEFPNNTVNPQQQRLFEAGAYLKNYIFNMKTCFSYSKN